MKVKISGDSAQTIFESVRKLSGNGELNPGDLLPPVRELANQLGLIVIPFQRLISGWSKRELLSLKGDWAPEFAKSLVQVNKREKPTLR